MNKNKTVAEVIQEYRNRHEKPEYLEIGIGAVGGYYTYDNVTNLIEPEPSHNGNFGWIEFDSWYQSDDSNEIIDRHVRIQGRIIRYVESREE